MLALGGANMSTTAACDDAFFMLPFECLSALLRVPLLFVSLLPQRAREDGKDRIVWHAGVVGGYVWESKHARRRGSAVSDFRDAKSTIFCVLFLDIRPEKRSQL